MNPVAINVNGRQTQALVEPRTHLGDFLREHCRLTGTHLGCEHGVCGACTVLIDGAPARSCITYAVACEGQEIRTIEGFDNDAVMEQLREAFSREHGLQCGFCTPGMLIAARDIVLRLPDADEARIRVELSGNLCRCTGYRGIVNAVKSVIAARQAAGASAAEPPRTRSVAAERGTLRSFVPAVPTAAPASTATAAVDDKADRKGWTRFEESFVVARAPEVVWHVFNDIPTVGSCLPGAELLEHDERSAKGRLTVKLGPIIAAFGGSASIERDDSSMQSVIRGAGNDKGTGSRTKGEVRYRLVPEAGGERTRVDVVVEYSLQGALAQFSRSGIAQELGRRLVQEFSANLNARLGSPVPAGTSATGAGQLDAGRLLWLWLRDKVRSLFGR